MRLHLLQSILNFHKNQRNFAYDLLSKADLEWQQLQVNDNLLKTLIEMGKICEFYVWMCIRLKFISISGYSNTEARIGLRSCANNVDQAINFIHDRRERLQKARKQGKAERKVKNSLTKTTNAKWVNPRTLHTLSEMGFDQNLCALALQKTDNDINQAVGILDV